MSLQVFPLIYKVLYILIKGLGIYLYGKNAKYREFLPYANFITANFITAVFKNFPDISKNLADGILRAINFVTAYIK